MCADTYKFMNLDKFIMKITQMGSLINDYAEKKHCTTLPTESDYHERFHSDIKFSFSN